MCDGFAFVEQKVDRRLTTVVSRSGPGRWSEASPLFEIENFDARPIVAILPIPPENRNVLVEQNSYTATGEG